MLFFKVGNLRLILGEDLFFLRDHYDFSTESRKSETNFRRRPFFFRDQCDFFGDQSQNGPGLKNVGQP